jgi:hypothetical protein
VDLCKKKEEQLSEEDDPQAVGDFFIWRCVKRDTKLRLASHVDKYDQVGPTRLLEKVKRRTAPEDQPLFVSDGGHPFPPAMLQVWGQPCEEGVHRGPRWKRPRWQPAPEVLYARAIKRRDAQGHLLGIDEEVTWGDPAQVWSRLDPQGEGRHISTFCIERDNLTTRLHNSRLARETLRFSKARYMLEWSVELEDAYYNLCLPHDSLKQPLDPPQPTKGNGSPKKWVPRTPMMAEGLTDHIWTLEELLSFHVPSRSGWTTNQSP